MMQANGKKLELIQRLSGEEALDVLYPEIESLVSSFFFLANLGIFFVVKF